MWAHTRDPSKALDRILCGTVTPQSHQKEMEVIGSRSCQASTWGRPGVTSTSLADPDLAWVPVPPWVLDLCVNAEVAEADAGWGQADEGLAAPRHFPLGRQKINWKLKSFPFVVLPQNGADFSQKFFFLSPNPSRPTLRDIWRLEVLAFYWKLLMSSFNSFQVFQSEDFLGTNAISPILIIYYYRRMDLVSDPLKCWKEITT